MHIKYFASSYYVISCFLCSNLNNFPNLHRSTHRDEFGTQRVYKKTSPNCVLTLYLPTREITLTGNNPSVLRGIVYVDPKAIQGYRVYAQLTLTFRWVYALFSFLVMVKPLMVLACSNFFFVDFSISTLGMAARMRRWWVCDFATRPLCRCTRFGHDSRSPRQSRSVHCR